MTVSYIRAIIPSNSTSNIYQSTLILASSLPLLHSTNRCSAQEPTSTTDLEFTIIVPSSEIGTIGGTTADTIIDRSTTSAMPESPTADPEFPSVSTFYFSSSDPASESNTFSEPTPIEPSLEHLSSDFVVTVNRAILQECNTVTISW